VTSVRRDLQRTWLNAMGTIVTDPQARTPADARALARSEMRQLDGRLARALSAGGLDATTRARFEETRVWTTRTLDAGVETQR
jgi:hypothetical protein